MNLVFFFFFFLWGKAHCLLACFFSIQGLLKKYPTFGRRNKTGITGALET